MPTNKENNDIDDYDENGSKREAISHIQTVNNCKQNTRPSPVINQYPERSKTMSARKVVP